MSRRAVPFHTDRRCYGYDDWDSGSPYDWSGAARGDSPWDNIDFHLDLGCGRLKKARIGIDRFPDPGVNIVMDLDSLTLYGEPQDPNCDATLFGPSSIYREGKRIGRLPFDDCSIESAVSHHFLEHVGDGFVRLIDEVHRVLVPGGVFRAITPLFPSRTAVEDPDHRRYFMEGTWETFCGASDGAHWHESFSTPYTKSRFEKVDQDISPPSSPEDAWGPDDAREIRVALRKYR